MNLQIWYSSPLFFLLLYLLTIFNHFIYKYLEHLLQQLDFKVLVDTMSEIFTIFSNWLLLVIKKPTFSYNQQLG